MRYCGRDGAISEAKSAIADFSEAGSEATAAEAAEMIVKQNCLQFCLFNLICRECAYHSSEYSAIYLYFVTACHHHLLRSTDLLYIFRSF